MANDPDGDSLAYMWHCSKGAFDDATSSVVSWTAPAESGSVTVTVVVADGREGSDSKSKTIAVVRHPNRPPAISAVTGPDSMVAGATAQLTCIASDPDGDSLTYRWSCSGGGLSSQYGRSVEFYAPTSPGGVTITVIAEDEGQLADTARKFITVNPVPNRPPAIQEVRGSASVSAGSNASYECIASDPDGDSLTYSWTCTRGRLSSSSGRTVIWTAPDSSCSAVLTVEVRDGRGGRASDVKPVTVTRVYRTHLDTSGVYIAAGGSAAWYMTVKAGYTAYGNFSVPQHGITFMVVDSVNYYRWYNRQSYSYLVRYYDSGGTAYSVVIPTTRRYYFVLDNRHSLVTPKYASLSIKTMTQ